MPELIPPENLTTDPVVIAEVLGWVNDRLVDFYAKLKWWSCSTDNTCSDKEFGVYAMEFSDYLQRELKALQSPATYASIKKLKENPF